ncbi:Transketolase [Metarhizium album ARSEF 1941]|uniref:Transketolase n=1 Tax=Metarhizium album (strain ARSEF 1941) TaxID=1081103 RepID=A0A0B2WZY4_METAS|nr:Transketolase [Metarhizium album ARSEF 1941]KHN98997.1 Transketolase [Metarhizium album ARSEF 1941]
MPIQVDVLSALAGAINGAVPPRRKGEQLTKDDRAVLAVRNLVYDVTMQNGGGHGGSAVGMAAIGVALWKYVMRYNPNDAEWFDRDRFVLSNGTCAARGREAARSASADLGSLVGHASIFLYVMNYLVGYEAWTLEELRGYGSAKLDGSTTLCHAHPEIECPAVEVTTGPLGQGVANAVGLAIASKNLAANFNRPGIELVKSRIYCMTGDGCLMEGVALEGWSEFVFCLSSLLSRLSGRDANGLRTSVAISLAGNLQLDNLVLVYDNNQVTCDGPLHWINVEDTNAKMRASGWHVIDVDGGTYDVQAIVAALRLARASHGKPVFLNVRTVIGADTAMAGTAKAHHGPFDKSSIERSKALAGLSPQSSHQIPQSCLDFFRERKAYGAALQQEWEAKLIEYMSKYPEDAKLFLGRMNGYFGDWKTMLENLDSKKFKGKATRESNGEIVQALWNANPAMCGGGADLVNSNKFKYSENDVFHPTNTFRGSHIRNGIREHAMAAVANGLAAYNPGTFLPVTTTFLMFYLYAAPGVRMGALSHLQVLHIATHDSFQEGQNGPTHQPVEIDSLFRAMPGLTYIRPCDAEEVMGAYLYALEQRKSPSMISVARDPTGHVPCTSRLGVSKGAYVIKEQSSAAVTMVSCGSQLHIVVATAEKLERQGISTRIVSAPSLDIFERQPPAYRQAVFPVDGSPIVSVEEYVALVWARYVTASIGMTGFGYSASSESNYQRFGLDTDAIVAKVAEYLGMLEGSDARGAGWRHL